jgi:hypothetical protein
MRLVGCAWLIACWATTGLAQSTLLIVPTRATDANIRNAANGVITLMTPDDNAALLAQASEAGVTCAPMDAACWQRAAMLGGATAVLVVEAPSKDSLGHVWMAGGGVERDTPVLSAGAAGLRFALQRIMFTSSAVVVSAPTGALIHCDAAPVSAVIDGLAPGKHTLDVSVGNSRQDFVIDLGAGEVVNIDAVHVGAWPIMPVALGVGGGVLVVGGVVGAVVGLAVQHNHAAASAKQPNGALADVTTPWRTTGVAVGVVGVGLALMGGGGLLWLAE